MQNPNGSFRKVFAAGLAITTALWTVSAFAVIPVVAAVEAHPAGTLVNSGGTVWLITDDGAGRQGFDSAEKFYSHRFDFADVVPANSSDLALADQGLVGWGSGVLFNDSGTVYQVSGGQKHGFTSATVFTGLGYNFGMVMPGNLSSVPEGAMIDSVTGAHLEGTFVNDSGTVYMVTATGKKGFSQPGSFFSQGVGFEDVVMANAADKALVMEGVAPFRVGTLVNDSGTVWAMGDGTKHGFPSASCFTGFGFSWSKLISGSTSGVSVGSVLCASSDTGDTGDTSSTGTLTVSLASDTPAEGIAIASAARVPFTKVNLTATGGDVVVDSWAVERTGVASDSTFSSLDLVDASNNAVLNDNAKSLSSEHKANFTDDLTVKKGETRSVYLTGTIAAAATAGNGEQPKLALNSVTVKGDAKVVGSFPVVGNKMTVNTSITLGTATVQRGAYTNSTNTALEIGKTNYTVFSFQIQAGSGEDMNFDQIKVYQQGSASLSTDLENIRLLKDGTEIATGVVLDSNNVNFSFDTIKIPKGQTQQYQVKVDIVDGSARTIDFGVWRALDIHLVGTTYNAAITPTVSGTGSSSASPVLSDNTFTLSQGTLRVARSSTVAATNIAVGSDQELGAFEFEVKGEPVVVSAMTLTVASSSGAQIEDALQSVKLVNSDDVTVAGPTDVTNNALTVAWTDTFTIPVGTNHYKVVGTLATNGGWASNDTVTVSLQTPASAITATGDVSGQSITASPSSNISASQQTVKAATLTVTKNATPTNKTVVVNDDHVLAGSWTFDASNSGEDVRVTSVAVRASTTSKFSNLSLENGGTVLDTNDNPVSSNNANTTSTFALATPLVVTKGTSAVVDLYMDIPSNANAGEVDAWGITSSGALSAFGVETGNSATVTVVANDGAALTVAAAGTLTVNLHADAPAIRQVVHGSTGVVLTAVDMKATNEPVDITQMIVRVADGDLTGTNAGTFNQLSKFYVKLGGVVVGSSTGYTIGQATKTLTLSRGDVTIPEGDSGAKLEIVGDIVSYGTNLPGVENADIKVGLNGSNAFTATGNGSNSSATVTYNDSTGSAIILHKAVPSVVTETIASNKLASGASLHRSKISAVGNTVGIYRLSYTVTTSTGLDVDNAYIKLVSCGGCGAIPDGSQLSASDNGDYFIDGTFTYDLIVDPTQSHGKRYLAIAAGQTATVDLVANSITGFTTNSDSATTQLLGDTATTTNDVTGDPAAAFSAHNQGNFVWSPLHNDQSQATSALTSKQWYNGYYVSGLGATASSTSAQTYAD